MYKPLPDNVTIKESSIHGLGLFATTYIKSGTNIGLTHIRNEEFEDGYIRTPLGGFFNHNSIDPNTEVVHEGEYIYLLSISDIYEGDEITAMYTLYNPEK